MLNKLFRLITSYFLTFIIGVIAKTSINGLSLDFLWIVFLPLATFVSLTTFDLLLTNVDFAKETLNKLDEKDKAVYTIALAVLSAGFAIAVAIFLR